ncbi:hypothetical protein M752DRAFT_34568 [Aspergillus phoenicis ATCC 13157]|uniref:Uncharacterized protein n=1 Tax=Aspergillus phoenicis ATCC 13157 TaxID=1353007 RepID=A0A370PEH3_ASPPH|nr:hypothetical protein M752DRAFT_34568 [Aspergillus phoenicis ATCC 13157]
MTGMSEMQESRSLFTAPAGAAVRAETMAFPSLRSQNCHEQSRTKFHRSRIG